MQTTLTDSIQDYLKHIYDLTEAGGNATTNALAAELGVKPASVTGMLQRMASTSPALVEYHKHQGATLTKEGRRRALEVIRHHRLLETWLVETLGYTWDEVHKEAEQLEHVISEDFERRVAAALGNPDRDPHGELIPTEGLDMPSDHSVPLSELRTGHTAVVRAVKVSETALLRQLQGAGLIPGARILIASYSPFDHNLTVRIGRKSQVVGPPIANKILVEKEA